MNGSLKRDCFFLFSFLVFCLSIKLVLSLFNQRIENEIQFYYTQAEAQAEASLFFENLVESRRLLIEDIDLHSFLQQRRQLFFQTMDKTITALPEQVRLKTLSVQNNEIRLLVSNLSRATANSYCQRLIVQNFSCKLKHESNRGSAESDFELAIYYDESLGSVSL